VAEKLPSVVIVGRPNVGKSTLFNRLTGTRRSIVTDEPGITRDRIYGTASWEGKPFEVVDTGGIVPDEQAGIPGEILRQARFAIDNATAVVQVVDAREGPVPLDLELTQLLRRAGKPPVIAANKVDSAQNVPLAAPFFEYSDQVFPISCEHGFGIDDMLDALTASFPKGDVPEAAPEINVAIIGRPNVGKSTLLNRLVGEERAIVSDVPGTTRDAVDTVTEHNGIVYRFLDTAGIRRKGKTKLVAEKLSVIMAKRHLERADIALIIVDAAVGVTSHDATIASYAEESGRSVIIVMNKWDLALKIAREKAVAPRKRPPKHPEKHPTIIHAQALAQDYEKLVREKLKFLSYAPVIFVSALTGDQTDKLFKIIDEVAAARRKRITTGELNRWLAEVDLERGTTPASRKVKIFYITESSTAPPTFILFTNQTKPLHFSFQRFLENRLREKFDFTGAPIRFIQRLKIRSQRSVKPEARGSKPHRSRGKHEWVEDKSERHGRPASGQERPPDRRPGRKR
jgi:GTP-binding protein